MLEKSGETEIALRERPCDIALCYYEFPGSKYTIAGGAILICKKNSFL